MSMLRGLLCGAAAGAAGTTALNAVTYLDMALRGRAASGTPQDTVEKLSATLHVPIPGDGETRDNRVSGLGPLLGLAAGTGVGTVLGTLRAAGWQPRTTTAVLVAGSAAMAAGNGPMMVLGVTDLGDWSASDWLSDIVPHFAYGLGAAYAIERGACP
jgi:hypothetical protein